MISCQPLKVRQQSMGSRDTGMTIEKLFFFHLPKAGGTSIISALKQNRAATIAPLIENNALDHSTLDKNYESFKGYDVYAGHYGRDVFEAVNDGHAAVTNFRHPVARISSLYRYFRYAVPLEPHQLEAPHHKAVRLAKTASFEDFTASTDEDVRKYTSDFHFRQLCCSPWESECGDTTASAKDFIHLMPCVFICEYPAQSSALFRNILGVPDIDRLNTGGNDTSDDPVTRNAVENILSMNKKDLDIYDFAIRHFLPNA
jgi:hypothetical protein